MISSSAKRRLVGILLVSIFGLILLPSVARVLGQDGDDAAAKPVGDKKCFICHQEMRESFALSIHAPLAGAEDSTACESCHGPGRAHVGSMGDLDSIVRFSQLTPKESATRCLSCHEKTAGSGHIKGFLTSKWMTEGKSCTTCHDAHGAKHAVAVAEAKPAAMTTEACLVCHSDRKEMVEFPHLARTADLRGCETCHGSGYEHAVSRGAPGTIVNPRTAPAARADASCLMCHQDMTAPEHFKPSPGKERCVDCHGIHKPAPVPAVAAAPTPGRPEFRLETADAGAAAELPAFRIAPLPPTGGEGYDFLGMNMTGDIKLGFRSVDQRGNADVYRQREDYQPGIRLFDAEVEGRALGDSDAEFYLSATGVGDPVAHYDFTATDGEFWEFAVKGQMTSFHYAAFGDPWNWRARTSIWGFDLTLFPKAPLKVTLGYEYDTRDGRYLGSRLISGSVTPTNEPFSERGNFAYVRIDWDAGPLDLSLTQGYRWENLSEEISAQPDGDSMFQHRIHTEFDAPITTLLGSYRASPEVIIDTKLVYSPMDSDTDIRSGEIQGGPNGQLQINEQETVDGSRDNLRAELGGTWFATTDLSFIARAEYYLSDQDSDGRVLATSNLGGSTPEPIDTHRKQDRWRFFAEGNYRPVAWGMVRLGYEWATDDVKISVDEKRYSEDSTIQGPVFGFDLDPSKEISIDFLYRFMKDDNPMTEIGTQDRDQARLKLRWTPQEMMTFTVFGSQSRIQNTRHDTDIKAWVAGFNAHFMPMNGLTFDAGYDYRSYDTETDVVRYIDGVPNYGLSQFESRTSGITFSGEWQALANLTIDLGGYWSLSDGDYPVDVMELWIGAEYEFMKLVSVGTDLRWSSYKEKDTSSNNYNAYIWELWLRYRF